MMVVIMFCTLVGLTILFNIYIHRFTYEQDFLDIDTKATHLGFQQAFDINLKSNVTHNSWDSNETAVWLWLERLQESAFQIEMNNLKIKIEELKVELEMIRKGNELPNGSMTGDNDNHKDLELRLAKNAIRGDYPNQERYFSHRKQSYAELFKYKWHDYDITNNMITPFSAFSASNHFGTTVNDPAFQFHIFPAEGQSQIGVTGQHLYRKDLSEVLEYGLNKNPLIRNESFDQEIVEGLYRTEPMHGSEYFIVYKPIRSKDREISNNQNVAHIIRPYMKLQVNAIMIILRCPFESLRTIDRA